MSFYQKYRPKDFSSVFGQEFVKASLQNALKQNKLVGAYLFYGSRGTGKTSVARILAKGFNCLNIKEDGNPCLKCKNCIAFENEELLDIIEIDAASNTGVDNIRDLIEKSQFQPNQAKYKVYIIDEVHMLSKGAFNALLKTLEEPPAHVKFILATTEIHKIPETIISRTQRYDFKRISENDIVECLKLIARSEDIHTEQEALKLIARIVRGSLRDAISFLEQYSIGGSLKLEYLRHNLQLVGEEFLGDFIENIFINNKEKILGNLDFLRDKGIDVKIFLEEIIYFLRGKIIESFNSEDFTKYIDIYESLEQAYGKLKYVPNTFTLLEITVLKLINGNKETKITKTKKEIKAKEEDTEEEKNEQEDKNIKKEIGKVEKIISKDEKIKESKDFNIKVFIDNIKSDPGKGFIAMILKTAKFNFLEDICIITTNNDFNFEKLNNSEVRPYLINKLQELFGLNHNIAIELQKQNTEELLKEAQEVF